jgi:hypothetical protein
MITAPREKIIPDAWKVKDEMKQLELARIAKVAEVKAYYQKYDTSSIISVDN